jgi:hypothetical protein
LSKIEDGDGLLSPHLAVTTGTRTLYLIESRLQYMYIDSRSGGHTAQPAAYRPQAPREV